MGKNTVIAIGVFIVVAAVGFLAFYSGGDTSGRLDAFAQCLAAKGATMYGAYWCPHCLNEKRAFGSSFRFVPYVECTQEEQKCLAAGVRGYPTWIFPDPSASSGQAWLRLEGEQGVEKLSEASGCPLSPVAE